MLNIGRHRHEGRVLLNQRHLFFKPGRLRHIINIHARNVIAFGGIHPAAKRNGQAGVRLVDNSDTVILGRIILHDLQRAILRPIVDQNQLKIAIGLVKDALDGVFDEFFPVID